jgi:glutathione S-transferase
MPDIELFTSDLCPFARRVQLALLHKGIDFWHTEIDLENKPEWFMVIAPLGEVPVIRHEDRFVANSGVILEYLEDVYPVPSLRPAEPGKTATCRFWMRYADDRLAPAIERCSAAQSPDEEGAWAADLRDRLTFIEREGLARCGRGPFWLGRDPSILDFTFYPFFERLPAIQQLRPVTLPLMSIRLRYWLDAMRELDSVKAARNWVESGAEALHGGKPRQQPGRNGAKVEYLHA